MVVKERSPERAKGARKAAKKGGVLGEHARAVEVLWGEKERPSRGPKAALSAERIARAAIAVAGAEGLAAVSMHRVASDLGFTTMSLYRHVSGKAELVGLMIETAFGAPARLDTASGDWRSALTAWARKLYEAFLRYPWILEASWQLRIMGPNELGWLEVALGALAESGLTGAELFDAVLLVNGHVRVIAQHSIHAAAGQQGVSAEQWAAATAALVQKHPERFTALASVLGSDTSGAPNEDPLGFGLRCVLDGIGVLVAARAKRRA